MKCHREGCEQECGLLREYCSSECRNLQIQLSVRRLDAAFTNDAPTIGDLLDERQRAKRWTPETMEDRIKEIRYL